MSNPSDFERLILELFRELKDDIRNLKEDMRQGFEQVDKRFEQVDKRFEQIDKRLDQMDNRFDQMDRRLDRIETDVRADRDKLQQVYESRDKVTVAFTRSWASASFFIALIASTIVLAVAKAF